jgi:hypothetical protein
MIFSNEPDEQSFSTYAPHPNPTTFFWSSTTLYEAMRHVYTHGNGFSLFSISFLYPLKHTTNYRRLLANLILNTIDIQRMHHHQAGANERQV